MVEVVDAGGDCRGDSASLQATSHSVASAERLTWQVPPRTPARSSNKPSEWQHDTHRLVMRLCLPGAEARAPSVHRYFREPRKKLRALEVFVEVQPDFIAAPGALGARHERRD